MVDCGTITVEAESEFDESLVDISCDIQTPEIDAGETAVVDVILENNNDDIGGFVGHLTVDGEQVEFLNPYALGGGTVTETIEIEGLDPGVEHSIGIDVDSIEEA